MVVADLHVHTTNSDGTLTLSRLLAAARAAGLTAVAVTDHDRLHPGLDGPVSEFDGVTVIHGIELRVDAGSARVDLLGYGVRAEPALTDLVERVQADRIDRGRRLIDRVEAHLGVELDLEPREGLGRPHVARAIEAATEYGYTEAFERFIGDGCPCYVPRDVPSFEEGLTALEAAAGVVSLAHPYRYGDPEAALELCEHLDAVEAFYPYANAVDPEPLDRVVDRYDLLRTGGSDAHDERLGLAGVDRDEYRRVLAAI